MLQMTGQFKRPYCCQYVHVHLTALYTLQQFLMLVKSNRFSCHLSLLYSFLFLFHYCFMESYHFNFSIIFHTIVTQLAAY